MITPEEIFQARILIVDDNAADVALLRQMLGEAGYLSIASSRDPHEVAAMHHRNPYDLILLDLGMPGMDGFAVMGELRKIETDGHLPVMVITAHQDQKLRALKAGAKDFVRKPFDLAEVLVRVRNMIEVRLLQLQLAMHNFTRLENSQRIAGLGDWEYNFVDLGLTWSEGVYRILGLARNDFPPNSETFYGLVHPDDLAFVHREKQAVTAGSPRADFEHRIIRPDGEVRYIHQIVEVDFDAGGRPVRESGTFQDITERKIATEALRQSEERYRMLLTFSPDAHFRQVDGIITFANQAGCRLLGATHPDQLLGRLALDLVHPDDQAKVHERWERHKFVQSIPAAEMRFVRVDGTVVKVEAASVVFDFLGHQETHVIARDITERKQLDEHLLQAQKMEALGQFSGGVAHDFNNILASISGYAELSLIVLRENPMVRDYLGSVMRATNRAADLVRQILTFSRQEPQERRVLLLQPIVAESVKLMRSTIPSTIEFDTLVAPDAPPVLANANQIHQVLMNLAINAWHAMKDRPGRLQIKLEKVAVDAAYAASKPRLQPGGYARISVSDTGTGMDQATLQRIYEPFFTTKPPGEGTGLGLSVVHGIMDNHDGAITVHSQPGEGTVFCLYFPEHAGELALGQGEEGPAPRGHGERLLVVDDEELLAQLGENVLTRLGYAVESTTKSARALELVRADPSRYAAVITDQTMPGMTGLHLASRLHEIRPGLPIMLMTGYNLSLTADRVVAAGISNVLLKPFTIHTLGAVVHATLAGNPTSSPHGSNSPH
jgi:PAS domain S-box-containing protein